MELNSKTIREETIKLSCQTGAGHLAPSLSIVELLVVLFNHFLVFNRKNPKDDIRDRLVISKGHGCYAYYVILNHLGFISKSLIGNFNKNDSVLKGCLEINSDFMIEASTGSLGHGLPIAVGMAKAFKIKNRKNRVICIVGDGEMQEGSNWEALMLAYRFKLDNLLIIIDANNLQALGYVEDIAIGNDKLASILRSFFSDFFDIDGHNEEEIYKAYEYFYKNKNSNSMILFARTVKGKGLKIAENSPIYHFRCPTIDGYKYE